MPELPEVQTLVTKLKNNNIFNSTIIEINIIKNKLIKNSSVENFKKYLLNESIIKIERVGKYILFKFTNKKNLLIHLRMEGKIIVDNFEDKYILKESHVMMYFVLKNKKRITYFDSRMFGTFHIYNDSEINECKELNKLGVDPIKSDLPTEYLMNKFKNKNVSIKIALLDQTIISGIGNIYANEILFSCKINPYKKASELNENELKEIICKTKIILQNAIEHNGTTVFSFKYDQNHTGSFQEYLKVHNKKGFPCEICGTNIEKTKIGQRGTYFCRKCQGVK